MAPSSVAGKVVLVTGASGGIGRALVDAFVAAGAAQVVEASRHPREGATPPRRTWLLDLASPRSVAAAAAGLGATVDWVVNAGGVNANLRLSRYDDTWARREMEVNYFALACMFREFAPAMKARGGGVFVNVLSILAHVSHPMMASYCASKAAAWSLTQAMRAELAPHGVRVCAVFPPVVDTPMSARIPPPKLAPAELAASLIDAVLAGEEDIYPGAASPLREALLQNGKAVERSFAARLPPA